MKRVLLNGYLWLALLIAAIVATIVLWKLGEEAAKDECREHGGRVLTMHGYGVRDSWACQEAAP